jgi:Tn3 transposase DDE domain
MMTRALYKLRADGMQIDPEVVAALSPYIRSHINRFGLYSFDLNRRPLAVDYELPIFVNGATSAAAITT